MKKHKQKIIEINLKDFVLSEFNYDESYYKLFSRYDLIMGRIISGSKSSYRERYPDHKVCFNANVVAQSYGKVWYGDLDLTLDREKLQEVANELHDTLYVLYEMDGRFENENQPIEFYKNRAIDTITPNNK